MAEPTRRGLLGSAAGALGGAAALSLLPPIPAPAGRAPGRRRRSAPARLARRRRARGPADAGEPLVRRLLRHPVRCARLRRPRRAHPRHRPLGLRGPVTDNTAAVPYRWTTYAERLQAAGISWKVSQKDDDYACNLLEQFAAFRDAPPGSELYERGVRPQPARTPPARRHRRATGAGAGGGGHAARAHPAGLGADAPAAGAGEPTARVSPGDGASSCGCPQSRCASE